MANFTDQGISNMLFTWATLNVSPGPEILDLFAERCSKLMDTFTSQVGDQCFALATSFTTFRYSCVECSEARELSATLCTH